MIIIPEISKIRERIPERTPEKEWEPPKPWDTTLVTINGRTQVMVLIGDGYAYDPDSKKCFMSFPNCDTTGTCLGPSIREVPCSLDMETQDQSPTDEFYRDLLGTQKLPSEQVIEDAKRERDEKRRWLAAQEQKIEEEIAQLTKTAREKAVRANAEAVKRMLRNDVKEELSGKLNQLAAEEIADSVVENTQKLMEQLKQLGAEDVADSMLEYTQKLMEQFLE